MNIALAVTKTFPKGAMSKKDRLKEIIIEKSLKRGDFTLASGAKSDYLFDLKTTMLDPEGANLIGHLVLGKLGDDIDAIGGLELGACPAVSNACTISHQIKRDLRFFYVRKEKKGRGTDQLIEGCELKKGDKVVILDDVTTKGGSVKEAIKAVQSMGCKVVKVLSIVDRNEGARENLARDGIALDCIFSKDEILL
jgi:orotate phosphoribosyltransferase